MSFEDYDKIVEETIPRYIEMQEQLTFPLLFETNEIIKCLDIGCGAGRSAYELLINFPNAQVTCIDISTAQIEKAKKNLEDFSGRVEFVCADFLSHEFEEQFDVIVSTLTLSCLDKKEKQQWLEKIKDLVADNGYFVCGDRVSFRSLELNDALDVLQTAHSHPQPITSELKLMKEAGFSFVDIIWRYREYAVWYSRK